MKAYVIKNKEGKYWQWLFNDEPSWEDKLYNGFLHYSKEDAEKSIIQWQLKDCEVVEVEIEETKEKYFIRDITIEQLRLENEELKSKLAERNVDYWEYQDKICKGEHIGILEKENAVLKKALRIAVANVGTADKFVPINRELDVFVGRIYQSNEFCMENGIKDGWINVDDAMYDYFIEQARESMK